MDWLYDRHPDLLAAEWQSIINRATPRSKVLWRSAALEVNFVDSLKIQMGGKQASVGDLLHYDTKLASELHSRDRVNTYGSFYIANLVGTAA